MVNQHRSGVAFVAPSACSNPASFVAKPPLLSLDRRPYSVCTPTPKRRPPPPSATLLSEHESQPSLSQSKSPKVKPKPGEPGHRFYDFSPDTVEAVRIRHLVVGTEQLCDEVYARILSNDAQLSTLAQSLSTCTASRSTGGDIGWWNSDDLVPSDMPDALVDDALLATATRARLNVVERHQSVHGWHVYVVEQVRHKLQTKHRRTPLRSNPNQKTRKKHAANSASSTTNSDKQLDSSDPTAPIPKTYALQTLGCQMNRSDSERMAGHLEQAGYKQTQDPFEAALLVLNTCNIREHAETKVYSYLGRHVARKRKHGHAVTLAVAGCVAQQEGDRMLRRIPELDLVFGPQFANRLPELLDEVQRHGCQIAATDPAPIIEDVATPRRDSSVTAWVNVSFGCGENCTFCTVGNVVRPVEQSRTIDAIVQEVDRIAKDGIREVVLLGQNIDAYGRDMSPKRTFAQLLRHVHDVEGIERIRFTTSHPRYISENLVQTCVDLPKVMPFFHIPPQSGDNTILKAMRRGYSVETFVKVVDRIRSYIPDAAIAGDMIVGFPGETEEQFQHSLDLIRHIKFDVVNTAAYSPRPHTPAATFDHQIPEDVKYDRLQRMNQIVTESAHERSQRYVGRVEQVLVEDQNQKNSAQVIGRTPTNRPVYFEGRIEELRGKLVAVQIEKAFPFSLQGKQAGQPR